MDRKELVLAEKRKQAENIAESFGMSNSHQRKITENTEINYWEDIERIVVPAKGHLIQPKVKNLHRLKHPSKLPEVEFEWEVAGDNRGNNTKDANKERLETIKELSERCDSFVLATDWDREGEVIGYKILEWIGKENDYKRMYFSSLEEDEIERAYNEKQYPDVKLLAQGIARNLDDPLTGLNLSKALTYMFKKESNTGITQAIGAGRVKIPILKEICENTGVEVIKEPKIEVESRGGDFEHYMELKDGKYMEITSIDNCKYDFDEIEIIDLYEHKTNREQSEPLPNTDDILEEIESIPAEDLMSELENMYLKGLITYPRTDSRDISDTLLESLLDICPDRENGDKIHYPNNTKGGKKEPITLTRKGMKQYLEDDLTISEKFISGFLYNKFLRATVPPLVMLQKRMDYEYETNLGKKTETIIYSEECKNPEECIDDMTIWNTLPVELNLGKYNVKTIDKIEEKHHTIERSAYRVNMNHYSDDKIVSEMKELDLGTKATRSSYPSNLRYFNYISDSNLPTQLGERVSNIAHNIGLDSNRTYVIEKKISEIEDMNDLDEFLEDTIDFVSSLMKTLVVKSNDFDLHPECPEGHTAMFKNFMSNGKTKLGIVCSECDNLYVEG